MRPQPLQVEACTAFRQSTTVDFTGADLFASYLHQRDATDERVLALFDELVDQLIEGPVGSPDAIGAAGSRTEASS